MEQLHRKKTRFPRFDKILVIQPIAEVYGEGNERQLCQEIGSAVETKIVRVISHSTTEITELTRLKKKKNLQGTDTLTLSQTTKFWTLPN